MEGGIGIGQVSTGFKAFNCVLLSGQFLEDYDLKDMEITLETEIKASFKNWRVM